MSNFNKKLSKRLHLNHAYGQLIALIFVPIMVLTGVGTVLVLNETSNSAKLQQRHAAAALLTRYQRTSEDLLKLVTLRPDQYDHAQSIMQSMFAERNLQRAAIIDAQGQVQLSIGYRDTRFWPSIPDLVFLAPSNIIIIVFMGLNFRVHNNPLGLWLKWTINLCNWHVIECLRF